VVAGHLKSATYQRLMVAILAKNCLYLAAFALVSTAAAAAVLAAACYSVTTQDSLHEHPGQTTGI
jgi:hypothetical protein